MYVSEIINEVQSMTDEDVHELATAVILQLEERREDAREDGLQCLQRVEILDDMIRGLGREPVKEDCIDDELDIEWDGEPLDSQSQLIKDFLCARGPTSPAGIAAEFGQ